MRMILVMVAALLLLVVGLLLLFRLLLLLAGRRPERFWRRAAISCLLLLPILVLFGPPAVLATMAAFLVGTRGDERAYQGPRVDAAGNWSIQDRRRTLGPESRGEIAVDPAVLEGARSRAVRISATDGVPLHGYRVAARSAPPRFHAVLAHGLFRNALELETAASLLHRLGGEVLLLELRNHGGSGRARPTFGMSEAKDVLAGAAFLRQGSAADAPLVLYGVSLGAAATVLAAAELAAPGGGRGPDGLILDSPPASIRETADNLMRDGLGLPAPTRRLTLFGLSLVLGLEYSRLDVAAAAARLPDDLPVLVIGGTDDFRTPPEAVRRLYLALRAPDGVKELWIEPGARHGRVHEAAPAEFERRLSLLVERALARARPER